MTNIAILGFGVVGGGVAELIIKNENEVTDLGGDKIHIKYILDLRDFPTSPFADRIIKDFSVIEKDENVSCVIECMGGLHPAFEFTKAALESGKHVITSNKAVVAEFGDELLKIANEHNVSYRFEAAVGGGIPVISPLISFMRQNKIREVRGILNGTTNYILTKMFSFGDSFRDALSDAQTRGYAEKDPTDDIEGIDACRKIAILSALVSGELFSTSEIHTEGITKIREADVKNAEKLGMKIKLIGRCVNTENGSHVMVAPFMVGEEEPLSTVSGVYNAIEVLGEPIGSVMFYGPGAGGGATASAIVGDLMQVMQEGTHSKSPKFKKGSSPLNFDGFECKNYLAVSSADEEDIKKAFGDVRIISRKNEISFITNRLKESKIRKGIENLESQNVKIMSRIRLL